MWRAFNLIAYDDYFFIQEKKLRAYEEISFFYFWSVISSWRARTIERESRNGHEEQKRIVIKTKHISTDPSMEFPFPTENEKK